MNWFKLECTTRAFVTALQLTVRYEMPVIIIIIIIINHNAVTRKNYKKLHTYHALSYRRNIICIHLLLNFLLFSERYV